MSVPGVRRGSGRRLLWAVVLVVAMATVSVVLVAAVGSPRDSAQARPVVLSNPATCPVGSSPSVPAYDPVNHYLYVPDQESSNVTVLTPNCHSVASITLPVMAGVSAIVYDPADNDLYASDVYRGGVYVLHDLKLIHTIPSTKIECPTEPAYDPVLGDVVVGIGCGTPKLALLSGTAVVKEIGPTKIWESPGAMAYDPTSNRFLVAYPSNDNVTFYNPTTFKVLGKIPVGNDPDSIAYDSANHFDYVSSYDSRNVSVFSSSGAGKLHATINVGSGPVNIGFSPKTEEVYVANSESANVSVINGTKLKAPIALFSSFSRPAGVVYDAVTEKMYVTDAQYAEIDVL
jgi:DNA-binding beta-propeller fold protein YncE